VALVLVVVVVVVEVVGSTVLSVARSGTLRVSALRQ
jgi:hypothetical protein